MQVSVKLDKIDYQLLAILQKNAKVTNAYLSKEIGLSQGAVIERVKRLENTGLIKSYYAQIDAEKAGVGMTFFIQVSMARNRKELITINQKAAMDFFLEKVQRINEIVECYHIAGSGSFLLKVVTKNLSTFQKLMIDEMSNLDEISTLESMVVLSVMKDCKVIPVWE